MTLYIEMEKAMAPHPSTLAWKIRWTEEPHRLQSMGSLRVGHGIFNGMMEKGLLRRDDPRMVAFAYTAPISALIHLCDREPEKTEEAIAQVEAFSRHFVKIYGDVAYEEE